MNGRKGRCVDKDGHTACGNDNLKSRGDCGNLIKLEENAVAGGGNGVKPDCQCCATKKLSPDDVRLILQWVAIVKAYGEQTPGVPNQ